MPRASNNRKGEKAQMNNFLEEVKAAVSGRWPKPKTKPRKIHKTPEEIWEEVNN